MKYRIPDSHGAVLDRQKTVADVEEHLSDEVEMLEDMVDYGTRLLIRCLPDERDEVRITQVVVLAMLFREYLEFLDGISVLLKNGCVASGWVPLRALHELSVYMQWILDSESEIKAKAYYVGHVRRQRMWHSRIREESPDREAYLESLPDFEPVDLLTNRELAEAERATWDDMNRLLASDEYQPLNRKFDEIKGERPFDPSWYTVVPTVDQRRSLRQIATEIDRLTAYTLVYEQASDAMHGRLASTRLSISDGFMNMNHLRMLDEFDHFWHLVCGEAIHVFQLITTTYREGEDFSRVYSQRWQALYRHHTIMQTGNSQ